MESDRQQSHVLDAMEDRFNRASSIIEALFQDRFFNREPLDTYYFSPFGSSPRRSFDFHPKSRLARNIMPFPMFRPPNFPDMFQTFFDMIHQAQQAMDPHILTPSFQFPMPEFTAG